MSKKNSKQMLILLPSYSSQEHNDAESIPLHLNVNDYPLLITSLYKCFCIWVNCTMLFIWENYSLNNKETAFYKNMLSWFVLLSWNGWLHGNIWSLPSCLPILENVSIILYDYCNKNNFSFNLKGLSRA